MYIILVLVALVGTGIYYTEKKIIQKVDPSYQDLIKTFLYTVAMGYLITFFIDESDGVKQVPKVKEILTGNPPF